jgi:DNA-binding beta-propeller fold protein YncE
MWGSQGSDNGLFFQPTGVAVDGNGNVYVADSNNQRIQMFTSDGAYLGQWGHLGATDGLFNFPYGVAASPSGLVYVTDSGNSRVEKFGDSALPARNATWGSVKARYR